jgi:hypothetical protein
MNENAINRSANVDIPGEAPYQGNAALLEERVGEPTNMDVFPTIVLGDIGPDDTATVYALHFFIGPPGGTPLWQGSMEATLPQQSTFAVSRAMVPHLVTVIGKTVHDESVSLQE